MKKLFILIALLIPFATLAEPKVNTKPMFDWRLTVTDNKGKVTTLKVDPKGRNSFILPSEWMCGYTAVEMNKKENFLY